MTVILGIDPGSRFTGFGIIQTNAQQYRYVASGCINVSKHDVPERLKMIYQHLSDLIVQHAVTEASIERVFMHINPASALKLGQARGAAIVAVGQHALPLGEYSPRQIKQAIVGYGGAVKGQMQHMVKQLLNVTGELQEDAADALAIAICHANTSKLQQTLKDSA